MSDAKSKNTNFGLPENDADKIARLTAALEEANAKLIASGVDMVDPDEGTGPMDSQGFPKDYVWVEIYPGRDKQDLSYVPLGIKGYAVKVTRGVKVILPKAFIEVLDHAVEDVTIQSEGGLITRPSLRFPFRVHGPATEDEYKAFSAQMREQGKTGAAARA